ncbi:hypothetical protein [Streptosporangium roseum]|uniref:Uncharacterized protein n=1 Tax=Streptosporangium roseum (strain ATCC 12428 / DSM 43021 / JCM 3005 / KCTC 9067 / NCIMB 10171 / NRRL 2505 / NI 9100) TaxID=479432 RepID=D2B099_STRRD|nr:hypothetical protein [Streptosporangium roseum]ACZ89105.1 hypothetical protein Sros_6390 [Streptosporangium roseum DSM 43021]
MSPDNRLTSPISPFRLTWSAPHEGRAWIALGYASWGQYAAAEFGIGRAHAYRRIDIATTADRLLSIAATATGLSPTGDSIALSGRALLDVQDQVEQVAAVLAHLAAQAQRDGRELAEADVAELLRRAISHVRTPPRPRAGDPRVRQGRAMVEELYAVAAEVGRMCLEIAPAYLPEADASDVLALFADEICTDLATVLAYRRYAITSDRRCLAGTL